MVLRQTEEGALLRCKNRGCQAYVTFKKKDGLFFIDKIETEHEHKLRANHRGRQPKVRNMDVEECYD